MNTFNRMAVVLVLLIAIPVCMVVAVAPVPVLQVAGDGLLVLAQSLDELAWYARLPVGILLSIASLIICIFLLVMQFRRPKPKAVRLAKIGGGEVEVSLKTITDRVSYDVDQLPGVLKTRPKATARKGGVVIQVDVEMAGDINVPTRAAQVVEVVRQAVEEKVGIKLAQPPKVKVQASPAPGAGVLRSVPRETPQSVPPDEPMAELPPAEDFE